MSVQVFSHLGICVADPVRSMRFYHDLLGFERLSKLVVADANSAQLVGLSDLELHSYFLERDGIRIELLHYVSPGYESQPSPRAMNRQGLTHLAMRVERLDELLVAIEAAGFEIMRETRIRNSDLSSDVVFVLDPDGVRIELIELPGDPRLPLGEPLDD